MATIYQTRSSVWDRAIQVVWSLLYLVEGLLAVRFVLKAIGANAAPFTEFVYRVTNPLMAPFAAVVRSARLNTGNNIGLIEWSTLIGMAVYWLLAWAAIQLFEIADADTTHTVVKRNFFEPDESIESSRPAYFDDDDQVYNYTDYTLRRRHPRL